MAIGYSIVGQLVLAAKAGLIDFTKDDVLKVTEAMRKMKEKVAVEVTSGNAAKKLAVRMKDKNIFFVAARHLVGATHVFNNQLNENSKVFSTDFQVPEINHHLMEGLSHPEVNRTALFAIFINSKLYSDNLRKRFSLTKEVVEKHDVETFEYRSGCKTKEEEAFEEIQFGAYVDFYVSMLYKTDPGPLPWVDYFKVRLGQPLGK
jgi:hypothetical protein